MPVDARFRELIVRVRAGDEAAAAEVVQQFEPEVRRYVRVRLNDPGLHRVLDSVDICQSVFAAFFVRVVMGEFNLDEPDQLARLLVTMARNKLADHARKPATRRNQDGTEHLWDAVVDTHQTPSDVVANQELLQKVRQQLSDEERWLVEQRTEGKSWDEIAAGCGGGSESLRKKLGRALKRACRNLGVDGWTDDEPDGGRPG